MTEPYRNLKKMFSGKRGVFFTISTVMILVSIFFLSKSYLDRQSDMENIASNSLVSEKMSFLADDIADYSYSGLKIGIDRESPITIINLSGTKISGQDPQALLDKYFDFITNNFSRMNNFVMETKNITPAFLVDPLNMTVYMKPDGITMIHGKYGSLQSITLDIYTNKTSPTFNESPSDSGNINFTVRIFDDSSTQLLDDTFAQLDATVDNNEFYVSFADGTIISVDFGIIGEYTAMLNINTSNSVSELKRFEIRYLNTKPVAALTAGTLYLGTYAKSPVKLDSLVLASD